MWKGGLYILPVANQNANDLPELWLSLYRSVFTDWKHNASISVNRQENGHTVTLLSITLPHKITSAIWWNTILSRKSNSALSLREILLISMLWHRHAIFKSKGDKLSSSAVCRIWTRVFGTESPLNARWQTDWAIEDQAKNLNSTARPYDQRAFSPLEPPLPFGFRTWLWWYTCLLLISMLSHRQAIFKSKGDACMRAYVRTYVHTNIQTYIHTYMHTYRHTYIHTYIHVCC